ncbi:hypothetical protein Ancab_010556 [Ancistrocladus abbreviatus]
MSGGRIDVWLARNGVLILRRVVKPKLSNWYGSLRMVTSERKQVSAVPVSSTLLLLRRRSNKQQHPSKPQLGAEALQNGDTTKRTNSHEGEITQPDSIQPLPNYQTVVLPNCLRSSYAHNSCTANLTTM